MCARVCACVWSINVIVWLIHAAGRTYQSGLCNQLTLSSSETRTRVDDIDYHKDIEI